MFYSNKIKTRNTKRAKINFSSFDSGMNCDVDCALMPYKQGKLCYNYSVKNGALKTGMGFKELELPKTKLPGSLTRHIFYPQTAIEKVWLYRYWNESFSKKQNEIVYYGANDYLYSAPVVSASRESQYVTYPFETYQGNVNALNYCLDGVDSIIFTSDSDDMWVYKAEITEVTKVTTAPKIISSCIHYERLFAIVEGKRNEVRFSDDLDPTNWNETSQEGGFIQFSDERGALIKVISFSDYVYVFREHGISRITAYGDQSEFSVSQVYMSSSKIYASSIEICGDCVMFLASDGTYRFDGVKVSKVSLSISSLFKDVLNDWCASAYFDNKYYLALKLNFDDGELIGCENDDADLSYVHVNNALIEMDLATGELEICRGVDVMSMCGIYEDYYFSLAACLRGAHSGVISMLTHDGKFYNDNLTKVWASPLTDFGYPTNDKIIREISIKSVYDCKIKVKTESEEKLFDITGSNLPVKIMPNMKCIKAQISFVSNEADSEISLPQLMLEVIG